MRWIVCLLVNALMTVGLLGAPAAQKLIIGAAEWEPWQIVDGRHLSGITIDILQELEKRTACAMILKPLPQKRMLMAFQARQIDAEPSVSPVWRTSQKEISVYTKPYVTTYDIILVRKARGIKGNSVREFNGLTLGCGLGYYYPEGFQEAFDRGQILREDTPRGEKNLMKLALKRIDGAIIENVQAQYLFNVFKLDPADFDIAYQFQPSKLSLRLHKSRQDMLPILNEAIARIEAEGIIEQIVTKYSQ